MTPSISLHEIYNYMSANKLYLDDLSAGDKINSIRFSIRSGDWKHEHFRCQDLFENKYGSHITSYERTWEEDTGSDTFSADYLVKFDMPVTD